ncbi:two-component system sensor histidine kinase RppB, partial [Geminocystis sp. GBBB08]|uniref:two-component system sensor histidine kinase RppB n=1 Tax=Geminocystis sp. GBBB08 TaxID=2604140 RepID=UPI0027E306D3
MQNNSLFQQTKLSLIRWYVSIFSGVITLGAFLVYEAIAHAHYVTINEELKTVTSTFHNSFEPLLKQPNKLEDTVTNIISDLCLLDDKCLGKYEKNQLIRQENYFFHFFDLSGNLIATAGIDTDILPLNKSQQELITFRDKKGIRYRKMTILLHTKNNKEWGYLQIGRSLEDFDNYVTNIRILLLLGLPILIMTIIIASFYLADKAIQPLSIAYQQKSQFSADVAHELRTPLSATKATLDSILLSKNYTIKDSQETIKTVYRQNQRLITIVNDLLILNQLDNHKSNINSVSKLYDKKINLRDIISDLIEEFAYLALQHNINLSSQFLAKESDIFILGNEEQIYRLITNLLINAIQNTSNNGKVTISLETNKKEAIIKIIDTGIGISKEEQKLIFNRFYQVNKARN